MAADHKKVIDRPRQRFDALRVAAVDPSPIKASTPIMQGAEVQERKIEDGVTITAAGSTGSMLGMIGR